MAIPTPTVEVALGATAADDPATWTWTDVTAYVQVAAGITIERGYRDGVTGLATPSQIKLTVRNSDGRWSPHNPIGEWYGRIGRNTPLRVRVDNGSDEVTLAAGYIDELPIRWDKSERYRVAEITASGVMRRLGQGEELASPTRRAILAAAPVAYWPCEDESGAVVVASGLSQGRPVPVSDLDLAADTDVAGSKPLLKLSTVDGFRAVVGTYTATTAWSALWVMRAPAAPAATVRLMTVQTSDATGRFWVVDWNPATPALQVSLVAGDTVTVLHFNSLTVSAFYGQQFAVLLRLTQNGTGVDVNLYASTAGATYGPATSTSASTTLGSATTLWSGYDANMDGWTLGHVPIFASSAATAAADAAASGYQGETPEARFARLCGEIPIPYALDGGSSDTRMGAQAPGQILDMLRQIVDAEQGMVFEDRDGDLHLRLRSELYAQSTQMTLSYAARRYAGIEPVDDDQSLVNRMTATRPGGASATYESAGCYAPSRIGVYADEAEYDVDSDAVLPYYAQWRVGLGTVEEFRYLGLAVDLHRHTDLIDTWLGVDIGDLIQLTALPTDVSYNPVPVLLAGAVEYLDTRRWTITINTVPYVDLWTVEGSGNLGRVEHAGSELAVSTPSNVTSLLVAPTTSEVDRWSAANQPYDLEVSGERVTLTAVTEGTGSFVAAGTAASAVNASVTPDIPAGIRPGDVALIFAAIRTTSGSVDTPSGWQVLAESDPAALLAAEHDPTVWYFETNVTGWEPTNCTFAWSTTQAHLGVGSGLLTVVGSPVQAYTRSPRIAVTVGAGYGLSLWVRSGDGASTVSAAIDWYDSSDAYLSTSTSGGTAAAAATWEERRVTATAPASAAYARYGPTIASTPTGETLHVDDVQFFAWPIVTFTGGTAGSDTSAQAIALRNVSLDQVKAATPSVNGSAQNITYPALSPDYDYCLILYAGWKQDDWTSVASPGTEIAEVVSTAGNDHGLVWAYQAQTTRADVSSGSFTVTGGVSAVSRGFTLAIRGGQTLTVTRAVNGVTKTLPARTPVRLWRAGIAQL